MRSRSFLLCAGAVSLAVAVPASYADTMTFTAALNGGNEVPAVNTPASGFITVTLNGDLLTVNEVFTGLTTLASAAHIHCCIAPGGNAPVVLPFTSFPVATSGLYTNIFDLSTNVPVQAFGEAAFIAGLEAGEAYANIHDVIYPGGEIRGLLVAQTPEPGSWALVMTGLLAVEGLRRRAASAGRRTS